MDRLLDALELRRVSSGRGAGPPAERPAAARGGGRPARGRARVLRLGPGEAALERGPGRPERAALEDGRGAYTIKIVRHPSTYLIEGRP